MADSDDTGISSVSGDSQASEVTGMVLAGGRSRRLGRDKVVLPFDGGSLLSRSVRLLGGFCNEVWISGRNPAKAGPDGILPGIEAPWLPDDIPGIGPMGGIITFLKRLERPLLVIACDLPLLDAATLERLLDFRATRPDHCVMTTFLQTATGFIESLVSVYEPAALSYLEHSRASGVYKLSRALPPEVRHELPYGPDEAQVFFNINRPEDLEALRAMHVIDEWEGRERPSSERPCG